MVEVNNIRAPTLGRSQFAADHGDWSATAEVTLTKLAECWSYSSQNVCNIIYYILHTHAHKTHTTHTATHSQAAIYIYSYIFQVL